MSGGSAHAHIVAKPRSGYDYVLRVPDDSGVVPATPTYRVRQRTLSTLHTRYHADVPGYVEEASFDRHTAGTRFQAGYNAALVAAASDSGTPP